MSTSATHIDIYCFNTELIIFNLNHIIIVTYSLTAAFLFLLVRFAAHNVCKTWPSQTYRHKRKQTIAIVRKNSRLDQSDVPPTDARALHLPRARSSHSLRKALPTTTHTCCLNTCCTFIHVRKHHGPPCGRGMRAELKSEVSSLQLLFLPHWICLYNQLESSDISYALTQHGSTTNDVLAWILFVVTNSFGRLLHRIHLDQVSLTALAGLEVCDGSYGRDRDVFTEPGGFRTGRITVLSTASRRKPRAVEWSFSSSRETVTEHLRRFNALERDPAEKTVVLQDWISPWNTPGWQCAGHEEGPQSFW